MEEAWLERHAPDTSIHLTDMPAVPEHWRDDALAAKWSAIRRVRRAVTGALELARAGKTIGASLEAAPTVHVDAETAAILATIPFDEICITSAIEVTDAPAPEGAHEEEGVAVAFARATGEKCRRCWRILPDVGAHAHPATCARCDAALTEIG